MKPMQNNNLRLANVSMYIIIVVLCYLSSCTLIYVIMRPFKFQKNNVKQIHRKINTNLFVVQFWEIVVALNHTRFVSETIVLHVMLFSHSM